VGLGLGCCGQMGVDGFVGELFFVEGLVVWFGVGVGFFGGISRDC
jgi:hypothetical protein